MFYTRCIFVIPTLFPCPFLIIFLLFYLPSRAKSDGNLN